MLFNGSSGYSAIDVYLETNSNGQSLMQNIVAVYYAGLTCAAWNRPWFGLMIMIISGSGSSGIGIGSGVDGVVVTECYLNNTCKMT